MTMKRRDALRTIGGLAGAAGMAKLLPGCGDNNVDEGPVGITTFVYLMMENRTYDHYLGARALEGLGGDGITAGLSNPDLGGALVAPFEAPDDRGAAMASLCDPDPPHGRGASLAQFNAGAMNGFVTEHQLDHGAGLVEPMRYFTRTHLPVTWALADAYTTCDRWFASVMGPTLPNRAYWHSGTSFGLDNNADVFMTFNQGVPVPTIYNRLEAAGVDWAYYHGSVPVLALLANPGPFQLDVDGHVRRFGNAFFRDGAFFEDCAAGRLPPVVYIDPGFGLNDDHPPAHPILGQELIGAIYTALAKSPQWKNILFVVTYDEHGGYYDHVAPPKAPDDTLARFGVEGFDQLGFRVPALVAGPYVKQGHVSSVQYDHTSALKHLQDAFGLEGLTERMAAANNLDDCIDFERLAAGDPAPPIELPVFDSTEWPTAGAECRGSGGFKPTDPVTEWADANPDAFAGYYDARQSREGYLQNIRNYLRAQGLYK